METLIFGIMEPWNEVISLFFVLVLYYKNVINLVVSWNIATLGGQHDQRSKAVSVMNIIG